MSARLRRKLYGVRRQCRRPRDWTRWYREGVLDNEPPGSVRLRAALWNPPRD